MSLYTRVKDLLDRPDGLLSDEQVLMVGRKEFVSGEASPVGAFAEAFNLRIKELQDLDFFSAVYFWANLLNHKQLNLVNYSKATFFQFLYFNLLASRLSGHPKIYFDYDPIKDVNGNYLKDFISDTRKNKGSVTKYLPQEGAVINTLFIDVALDDFDVIHRMLRSNIKCLVFARNFCTKKSKCSDYPYTWTNVKSQFLLSGLAIFSNFALE